MALAFRSILWCIKQYDKIREKKNSKKRIRKKQEELIQNVSKTFIGEMYQNSTVGSISELYDGGNKKYNPGGTFAQAWSVAEIFRIIL